MKDLQQERDAFWDLEELLPPSSRKKYSFSPASRSADATEAVEVVERSEAATVSPAVSDEKLTVSPIPRREDSLRRESSDEKPETVYQKENSFICKVEIYPWKTAYGAYRQFRIDAGKLRAIHGQPCRMEPFFSFVPQYSQMTREQLNSYLFWREQVRGGSFPGVDFSYLKLYLFELINLSESMTSEEFLSRFCQVWIAYRTVFGQLDRMAAEWLCDYCLIHDCRIPLQFSAVVPILEKACSLREVFLSEEGGEEEIYVGALLSFCSNYDFHTSRYASGTVLTQMEAHIPAAFRDALRDGETAKLLRSPVLTEVEREAYAHTVCAAEIKKKLRIRYRALSHSYELRALVTEMVKYSENRVRMACTVKSRLTVRNLPDAVRNVLAAYFDRNCPSAAKRDKERSREKQNEGTEAYWKLYDAEREPLSLLRAKEIEEGSWETTEQLVETFTEQIVEPRSLSESVGTMVSESATEEKPQCLPQEDPEKAFQMPSPFGTRELAYLSVCLSGGREDRRRMAAEWKVPEEAIADCINEIAADLYGDILLEDRGEGMELIEDYREIVEELFNHDETDR